MKLNLLFFFTIFLIALPVLAVQTPRQVPSDFPTTGTIRVLALRVEFVADTTSETTGNGKMNLDTLDPPHDKKYFEDRLDDLANYFNTVSYGKLNIEYQIYPAGNKETYTLSHKMSYYSDPENWETRINELFREAIELADGDVDFSEEAERTAVMVIRAGAPVSTDANRDSPLDLPSVFLPPSDLQEYLGGFIQTEDGVLIDRGMVVPEMAAQDGINHGLLGVWAQIFGYQLGLPSMFDTEKGETRIGGWGLMDVGSSNYRGFSPAHPCAWSKIRMGWAEPKIIDFAEDLTCTLKAVENYPQIMKISITPTEYFLLENRQRDANGDGMPNVDEYDFSLPGSGLLIWHIDEAVIEENLQANKINTNPQRKGVDLEEADGVQDFDEYVSGNYYFYNGFYRDPFFAGNNDRFSFNTIPNSKSNDGAFSHVTVYDISESGTEMTFKIDIGMQQSGWDLENTEKIVPNSLNYADFDGDGNVELFFVTEDSSSSYTLWKLTKDGQKEALFTSESKILPPTVCSKYLIASNGTKILFYYYPDGVQETVEAEEKIIFPAVLWEFYDGKINKLLVGEKHIFFKGKSLEYEGELKSPILAIDEVVTIAQKGQEILYRHYDENLELLNSNSFYFPEPIENLSDPASADGIYTAFSVNNFLYLLDEKGNICNGYPIEHQENISAPIFAETDWDKTNSHEIFVISEQGDRVYCWETINGATMEGFPKSMEKSSFSGNFLEANCVATQREEVFSPTAGDRIFGWELYEDIEGFPISVKNSKTLSSPMLVDMDSDSDVELVAISGEYDLHILDLEFGGSDYFNWHMYRSNPNRNGMCSVGIDYIYPDPVFIEENSFYAYPNPATEDQVRIRYKLLLNGYGRYVPEIRIFDLSGELIEEFTGNGTGSYNEIVWDISDIASGVYFCKLEMKTEVHFCKIAVVR